MPPRRSLPRWLAITVLLLVVFFVAAALILISKWPFTRDALAQRLSRNGTFQVEIGSMKSTYFSPGCVAENVIFRTHSGAMLMTIQRLTIQADYPGLLAHPAHIEKMVAEGARGSLPQKGFQQNATAQKDSVIIDELVVRNGVLELTRKRGGYSLAIHQLQLRNVGSRGKIPFIITAHLPRPDAEVQVTGALGPAPENTSEEDFRQRSLSGSYRLQGELGVFQSIAGRISSEGKFQGNFSAVNVTGTTESPNFAVKQSSHSMPLNTRFRAVVDLRTGEIRIPELHAQLGTTHLEATAAIAPHGRTVQLNVFRGQGQIQDLLDLFSRAPRSPITGPIAFQTNVTLPAQPRQFKQRVHLIGEFKIDPAHFTSGHTQLEVDQLSARAQGQSRKGDNKKEQAEQSGPESEDPDPVLSNLQGHVEMKDGTANFSQLSFTVPGATANMAGTFNLVNKRVDLHGTMSMQAKLSQTKSGVKSFFMKVLDPFFKKKNAGAVVPVAMTGVYGNTHFSAGPGK